MFGFYVPPFIELQKLHQGNLFCSHNNKNFMSVMLEPVDMTPGMKMQISPYQSLMKYRYADEAEFLNKLLRVELIANCRSGGGGESERGNVSGMPTSGVGWQKAVSSAYMPEASGTDQYPGQPAGPSLYSDQPAGSGQYGESTGQVQNRTGGGNKKLPIIIGTATTVVVAVLIGVIIWMSGSRETAVKDSGTPGQSVEPASSLTLEEPTPSATPESTPSVTPEPTPGTAAYTTNELIVRGNTPGNIKNYGLYVVDDDIPIWIDDSFHSVYKSSTYLYEQNSGSFTCLSYYDGVLYFLYNGTAYSLNTAADTEESAIAELSAYGGNIDSLYVATGCYFIHTTDGMLRRISRRTGAEEESIEVSDRQNLTFEDGWLYYVTVDSSGRSCLCMTEADHFRRDNDYYQFIYLEVGYFTDPVVDGDYVYALAHNDDETFIYRFPLDLHDTGILYDISDLVNADGNSDHQVYDLNVIGNNMFISTYDENSNTYPLYRVIGNGDGTYVYELASPDGMYPTLTGRAGHFKLNYNAYDSDNELMVLYYVDYS